MKDKDDKTRQFQFSITGITFKFVMKIGSKMSNIFLEFEIGGQTREVESEEVREMKTSKSKVPKNNNLLSARA